MRTTSLNASKACSDIARCSFICMTRVYSLLRGSATLYSGAEAGRDGLQVEREPKPAVYVRWMWVPVMSARLRTTVCGSPRDTAAFARRDKVPSTGVKSESADIDEGRKERATSSLPFAQPTAKFLVFRRVARVAKPFSVGSSSVEDRPPEKSEVSGSL